MLRLEPGGEVDGFYNLRYYFFMYRVPEIEKE